MTNGWNLWFAATVCAGIGGALKISPGDGFAMAAFGFSIAAVAALIRDLS